MVDHLGAKLQHSRWKGFLELGRVSNLPTIVSNATAGFYLGGGRISQSPGHWGLAILITACFYEGGMFLNDICDLEEDRRDRPQRPLPSGRVSRKTAIFAATLLFLSGLTLVLLFLPAALYVAAGLITLIFIYNFTHSRLILAPLLMGSCRGSVYLIAAVAGGWNLLGGGVWLMAAGLTAYVTAVSFIARDELRESLSRVQLLSPIAVLAVLLLPLTLSSELQPSLMIALFPALFWLLLTASKLFRGQINPPKAVGRLLAGMSLWDALVLGALQSISGICISWTCFLGARLWQRRIQST